MEGTTEEAATKHRYEFSAFSKNEKTCDDGCFTYSSTEQKRVETLVEEELETFLDSSMEQVDDEQVDDDVRMPRLLRYAHVQYLKRALVSLGPSYQSLDASRPWMCYWGIHSLALLGENDDNLSSSIVSFLKTCEDVNGGYGGGPGQAPHLATTYAAVMALVEIGSDSALSSINRRSLKSFLRSVKSDDGSFSLEIDGEADIRGVYCALAVASITDILDESLFVNTAQWVVRCQSYEGGFGGIPGAEAHGGYTFCGVAALTLIGKIQLLHISSLTKWLAFKQMRFEGGFQGRTNKLVDGCYGFWQTALFPVLQFALGESSSDLFDCRRLQEFLLIACQSPQGGCRDKPDKNRDLYHTCYVLSLFSIAQNSPCSPPRSHPLGDGNCFGQLTIRSAHSTNRDLYHTCYVLSGLSIAQHSCHRPEDVIGGTANSLESTHPIFNVTKHSEARSRRYFTGRPVEF